MPRRIRFRRAKGWRLPENAVYVGRPTKWGNPFKYPQCSDPVAAFRKYLADNPKLTAAAKRELRGKDLACWCDEYAVCHGDVLLEVANE